MISETLMFLAASFLITFITIWFIGKWNKKRKITGLDINKKKEIFLPESVGISLLLTAWIFSLYFYFNSFNINYLIWSGMITLFSFVGFKDDTKHKFTGKPQSWFLRAFLIGIISLVFAYIYFKQEILWVLLAALYVAGIASFQNTFAGLNGWEIGSGLIVSTGFLFLLAGTPYFLPGIVLTGGILALLLFNFYPAKVFPGDSGTLLIGAGLSGLIVLTQNTNLMIISMAFFIPHTIDILLKILTNPKDASQRTSKPYYLNKENKIDFPQGKKKYDFAKLLIKILGAKKETTLVTIILLIVAVNMFFWLTFFGLI